MITSNARDESCKKGERSHGTTSWYYCEKEWASVDGNLHTLQRKYLDFTADMNLYHIAALSSVCFARRQVVLSSALLIFIS